MLLRRKVSSSGPCFTEGGRRKDRRELCRCYLLPSLQCAQEAFSFRWLSRSLSFNTASCTAPFLPVPDLRCKTNCRSLEFDFEEIPQSSSYDSTLINRNNWEVFVITGQLDMLVLLRSSFILMHHLCIITSSTQPEYCQS